MTVKFFYGYYTYDPLIGLKVIFQPRFEGRKIFCLKFHRSNQFSFSKNQDLR